MNQTIIGITTMIDESGELHKDVQYVYVRREYGEAVVHPGAKLEPRARTEWDLKLIEAADMKGVPILGICYGMQLLNVYFGGSLYQDIAEQYGSALSHGSTSDRAAHHVTFSADFLGFMTGERTASAGRHHQAVKEVASGFRVVARADDGIPEAIAGRGHYGVQWHAESDTTSARIYGEFIRHCQAQARQPAEV